MEAEERRETEDGKKYSKEAKSTQILPIGDPLRVRRFGWAQQPEVQAESSQQFQSRGIWYFDISVAEQFLQCLKRLQRLHRTKDLTSTKMQVREGGKQHIRKESHGGIAGGRGKKRTERNRKIASEMAQCERYEKEQSGQTGSSKETREPEIPIRVIPQMVVFSVSAVTPKVVSQTRRNMLRLDVDVSADKHPTHPNEFASGEKSTKLREKITAGATPPPPPTRKNVFYNRNEEFGRVDHQPTTEDLRNRGGTLTRELTEEKLTFMQHQHHHVHPTVAGMTGYTQGKATCDTTEDVQEHKENTSGNLKPMDRTCSDHETVRKRSDRLLTDHLRA
ncbi:hypothetical protein RUM44_002894 [Polyplax serrata]|uniref:Uncharacterized protein n=1 Tax=Polyplax serrata TaxID=468196 RepID=A0ABR1AX05_POLSC